jgi:hypothetical protein
MTSSQHYDVNDKPAVYRQQDIAMRGSFGPSAFTCLGMDAKLLTRSQYARLGFVCCRLELLDRLAELRVGSAGVDDGRDAANAALPIPFIALEKDGSKWT